MVDPSGMATDHHEAEASGSEEGSRGRWLVLGGLALLLIPLAIALAVLRQPRWYPALELAQTELHVRDVGTSHTPLTGLVGRIGGPGQRGSHPGPLSFFALAPMYRLAGSTSWALQAATVSLHLAAAGTVLWIARRRGGTPLLLGALAALAAVLRLYGAAFLTEPWNPYLPMVWWIVFVLSVWSVAERDVALLPVAVVAGSLCAQTHISYVGLVGGLGGLALAAALTHAHRVRRDGSERARVWRWIGLSVVIGILLWAPPALDEVRRNPGNLSVLVDYFGDAGEDPVGLRRGGELVLQHLDPWRLLFGRSQGKVLTEAEPDLAPSLVLLVLWLISVLTAWRVRSASLLRLHGVLCLALGFGVISGSRVYGPPWAWLFQWMWGLTALIVVAIGLTWDALRRRAEVAAARGPHRAARSRAVGITSLVVVALVALGSSGALARDAAAVDVDDLASSRALRDLAPSTIRSIESSSAPGAGPAGSLPRADDGSDRGRRFPTGVRPGERAGPGGHRGGRRER